jgi:hypothetical protein
MWRCCGRASELERDFPFGVVRQLFEPVFFAAGQEQRSRLLAGAGGLAERVLSGAAVPDGVGSGDPFAVLHGLYWFAANLAGLCPRQDADRVDGQPIEVHLGSCQSLGCYPHFLLPRRLGQLVRTRLSRWWCAGCGSGRRMGEWPTSCPACAWRLS